MSAFPAGFNSPAKLSGPCLVKYLIAQSGPGAFSSTLDTIDICTAGSANYNAVANGNNQMSCDFTSTQSYTNGVVETIACGLAALNGTLTSNSGTFTLYNSATTTTFPTTTINLGISGQQTLIPSQVVVVPNAAGLSSLLVVPTSAATVAKMPVLVGAVGIVTSIFFSGLL